MATQTTAVEMTAAQQAEMIEILKASRKLLGEYRWGKGDCDLAEDLMVQAEKLFVKTGVFDYNEQQMRQAID